MSENNPELPRAPVYGPIHKLHRHALGMALSRLGATDFANKSEAIAAVKLVREQVEFGRAHLRNEDRHVHPLLRAIRDDAAEGVEAAHDEHEQAFRSLEALADAIEQATDVDRVALGRRLYLDFGRFVARDLEHMDYEERVIEPQIHAHCSDAEIHQIHATIIAETSTDEMAQLQELALRALNSSELEAVAAVFSAGKTASLAAE